MPTGRNHGLLIAGGGVRTARAQWLVDALRARGITNVVAAPDDDATARETRQRGAFLRLSGATP